MADVKLEQKQRLGREEAARLVAALAAGLSDDGNVALRLGSSTLKLSVAGQVDCELEVSVDGDEIELELELKWSTSAPSSAEAVDDESHDEAEEDEADEDEVEADEAEEEPGQVALEAEPEQHDSDDDGSGRDFSTVAEAQDSAADTGVAPPVQAESVGAVPTNRTPRARRGRPSASADTGQSASNGVDTAAVRAWATANGLSVSPRGRIRDEVLQAYRDAGN